MLEKCEEHCRGTCSCCGERLSIGTVRPDSVSLGGLAVAWRHWGCLATPGTLTGARTGFRATPAHTDGRAGAWRRCGKRPCTASLSGGSVLEGTSESSLPQWSQPCPCSPGSSFPAKGFPGTCPPQPCNKRSLHQLSSLCPSLSICSAHDAQTIWLTSVPFSLCGC